MTDETGGARPVVLVVDDDETHRALTAAVVEAAGMTSLCAGSAEEALRSLESRSVDAVLVDQRMPGMSGIEMTRRLRSTDGHRLTPVIFVSALDAPEIRIEALRAGATDFLVKPYAFEELAARVQAQLRMRSDWQSKMEHLRARAATVTDIAALAARSSATATANEICHRISRNHGGRTVAILSWPDRQAEPVPLAVSGSRTVLARAPGLAHRLRAGSGPWIHYSAAAAGEGDAAWMACAPMVVGRSPVGLLTIQGGGAQDEMLTAAMEYASTATLQLGPSLSESRQIGEKKRAVEEVLDRGAFEPVFQPVLDLRTNRVVGFEALTRLTGGSPILDFLADAEDARMLAPTELALLRTALERLPLLPEGIWMSVNLSPSVLLEQTGPIGDLLQQVEGPVVIELTEHERIEDYPAVRRALARLGEHVKLSVDDTGSGYASLRHVVDLRPHFLKLDRSWVAGVEGDETRQALVAGIVAFCEHTSTELIAEGIERQPERRVLEDLGVSFGQGYLLGRPGPLRGPEPP